MKKTFQLKPPGKHPDRVLEAIKHETRQYMRRERGKPLPEGATFWAFDCRFGATESEAQTVEVPTLSGLMDGVAQAGGTQFYVELLRKPGVRRPKPSSEQDSPSPEGDTLP
jgi:Family of unknown function (DUF6172)